METTSRSGSQAFWLKWMLAATLVGALMGLLIRHYTPPQVDNACQPGMGCLIVVD